MSICNGREHYHEVDRPNQCFHNECNRFPQSLHWLAWASRGPDHRVVDRKEGIQKEYRKDQGTDFASAARDKSNDNGNGNNYRTTATAPFFIE